MVARENFDGPPVWHNRRSFSQDNRTSPRNWQKWRDTRNQGLHVVPAALGVLVMPYFFSFLLETKSREQFATKVAAWIAPLRQFLPSATVGSRRRSQGQRVCRRPM